MATLALCRTLVRGFTGRLDPYQTPDSYIDDRVNEFYTVDFAERLNLQEEVQPFVLPLNMGQSQYALDQNFVRFGGELVCNDQTMRLYEDPTLFFQDYRSPFNSSVFDTGDGIRSSFSGNIGPFASIDGTLVFNTPVERFTSDNDGTLRGQNGGAGTYNRATGDFSLTFTAPLAPGMPIQMLYQQAVLGLPQAALIYYDQLLLRPVPDTFYVLSSEVELRNRPLQADTDTFLYPQWLRYIAYGASAKICEENGEFDTSIKLSQFQDREKTLVLARTSQNLTNARASPSF